MVARRCNWRFHARRAFNWRSNRALGGSSLPGAFYGRWSRLVFRINPLLFSTCRRHGPFRFASNRNCCLDRLRSGRLLAGLRLRLLISSVAIRLLEITLAVALFKFLSHCGGHGCLPHSFMNWHWSESRSGRALNAIESRSLIEGNSVRRAFNRSGFCSDGTDHMGSIDDGCVIHNQG